MSFYYTSNDRRTLEEHLAYAKKENIPATFKGFEPFQELWDNGFIEPNLTHIRLMYNSSRGDENYLVVDEFQLEGIQAVVHGGKKGFHNPRDILSEYGPYWEIDFLNPMPVPRKPTK